MTQTDLTLAATISKEVAPTLKVVTLARPGLSELFITAVPPDGAALGAVFAHVDRVISDAGATPIAARVFGVPAAEQKDLGASHKTWGTPEWPITWLGGVDGAGTALKGVHVHAVTGVDVERIYMAGRVVGSVFDDGWARHCYLGDLRAPDVSTPKRRQARDTFTFMGAALRAANMKTSNLVRTWLSLNDILSWYGELNAARDQFFRERGVLGGTIPASTGVGSAAASAIVADAYAIQSNGRAKTFVVPSPLQCSALEYGSSFSRAVEVDMPDHRRLLISGTASISPDGRTVHPGDLGGQIDLTMTVVAAILESRNMSWDDVSRATAYVKQARDAGSFKEYCAAHGLEDMPAVVTESDICRDDLLFEIEVDAITSA